MTGFLDSGLIESSGGYQIQRSLRFRASATASLSRTPASATNRQIFTASVWVKLGSVVGASAYILSANTAAGFNDGFGLNFSSGAVTLSGTAAGVTIADLTTTQVLRDPSAWYHIVYSVDTTQATAANRVKIYINGAQVTVFATSTYPAQNTNFQMNNNVATYIGRLGYTSSAMFDGYFAEVNFIDGQALTPSSFGQTDPTTGQWTAKKYTGTYGTNGFYLDFKDNSSTTNLCLDRSGNGNNWTPNNISLTAGATYDSMTDVPLAYGTTDRGNYATLSAIHVIPSNANQTFTEANLSFNVNASEGASNASVVATMPLPTSGKWYWEVSPTQVATLASTRTGIGVMSAAQINNSFTTSGGTTNCFGYNPGGQKSTNGGFTTYGATYTTTDVIGVAVDLDAGEITFYKNGVSQGVAFTGLTGASDYYPAAGFWGTYKFNFGQRPFAFTPPTGFKTLHTGNLPTPTIQKPNKHFDVVTQLGSAVNTGANLLAQFTNFMADFAWGKDRAAANNHQLVDTVRGSTAVLQSNTTAAETTYSAPTSGDNCVAWGWKAGGAAVTNTAGSISSQVSANAAAGFSIVTFNSGTAGNKTIGHGLVAVPKLVIRKDRAGTTNWYVQHAATGIQFYQLNSTQVASTDARVWVTAPTSSVFSMESGYANTASTDVVAYCFAEIPGYSKFGSIAMNASADGAYLDLGFSAGLLLLKRSDSTSNWLMIDTVRQTYNVMGPELYPNLSNAESIVTELDFTAGGVKFRNSGLTGTWIYAAWSRAPFNYALAR